jgi:hypothetical protein
MSDKIDTYSFLPWVREGIANKINDTAGTVDKLRATLNLEINVSDSPTPVQKTISLYGPGDITGIDNKAVIKTEPRNWITNFEPNYLPCIDFYDEDFPWRYSPDKPNSEGRLLPWLALVVLEEDKFEEGKDMTGKPLPYFSLKDNIQTKEIFQPCDQLWAWAHVHINRDLLDGIITTGNAEIPEADKVKSLDDNDLISILQKYNSTLQENPDLAYSRIICPVKLNENTAYHAFLIPAFESGRLAGLGKNVEEIFNAQNSPFLPTTMAWAKSSDTNDPRVDPQQFPVYYRWYFRTGNVGDFEYLVRLLEPKLIDSRVGTRNMNVTNPGSNVDGISDTETKPDGSLYQPLNGILRLGGALKIPEIAIANKDEYLKYENWDRPFPRKFQNQLATFVNLANDYSENSTRVSHSNLNLPDAIKDTVPADATEPDPDPLITPPIYGRWHALTQKLLIADDKPDTNWIHRINLDPRHRVTAGFGTKIIQKNQENYMESAWQQVGDVIEANRRIRQAQLAHFASRQWYIKNLKTLQGNNTGAFINVTQPVHARVISKGLTIEQKEETLTVNHQISISKVPAIIFSPEMRKFARPGGRIVKFLKFNSKTNPVEKLAERINNGEVKPAPQKKVPDTVLTVDDFSKALRPQKVPGFLLNWVEKYHWFKYLILILALIILVLLSVFVGPNLRAITPGFGSISGFCMLVAILLITLYYLIIRWGKTIKNIAQIKEENQTSAAVDKLPKKPAFKLTVAGENIGFVKGTTDSDEAKRFKQALKDVSELMQNQLEASKEIVYPKLNFTLISEAILNTINPDKSIPNYILKTKVNIPERLLREKRTEVFKEAMAYPELNIPMYKPLIDISADLFLPNINFVSQNSISLLETNQPFIEAYMVGLNHEFARELLWREYPTDQRGSCFRQFWDVSDFIYDGEDLENLKTIVRNKFPEISDEDEFNKRLEEEIRESLKDIPKIHLWSKYSNLGEHDHREIYKKTKIEQAKGTSAGTGNANENELVLVIRGELLKKYPNAVIYAHKAAWQPKSNTDNTPDKGKERVLADIGTDVDNPPRSIVKTPLYEAKVDPDIYFFGFDLTAETALGLTQGEPANLNDRAGWFFVIKERPGEIRFGLDTGFSDSLEVWNDFSWETLLQGENNKKFIQISKAFDLHADTLESDDTEKKLQREEDLQLTWNSGMNSAEIAYILYQAPVMMAVHAAEMLKPKN